MPCCCRGNNPNHLLPETFLGAPSENRDTALPQYRCAGICNTFAGPPGRSPGFNRHNGRWIVGSVGFDLIEMLVRLGLALLLSLTVAVLMAWGWSLSDHPPQGVEQTLVSTDRASVAPVQ